MDGSEDRATSASGASPRGIEPDRSAAAAELHRRLVALDRLRTPALRTASAALGLYIGVETQTDPRAYVWDGMRRGGDRRHPFVVWQYTLDGRGAFIHGRGDGRKAGKGRDAGIDLHAGRGFVAVVPSEHVYRLPESSKRWTFFWLITHHPYVVSRVASAVARGGPIIEASPESEMVSAASLVFERACRGFGDALEAEWMVMGWMIALERHFNSAARDAAVRRARASADSADTDRAGAAFDADGDAGDRLLAEATRAVLGRIDRPVDVSALAGARGLSRTAYSHLFRRQTGLSPAAFMARVRLEEAARRLMATDAPIKVVARETGFADANHFCKAFRRKYHLSPGDFRRRMTGDAINSGSSR